jgi:penicillin-binding protein-related factor A (putative recombinase)
MGKITSDQNKKTTNQRGSTEIHQKVVKKALVLMSTPVSRVWANNTGAGKAIDNPDRIIRFGLKGSSDIIGIYKGLFLGIEVKTGNAKQSSFQKNFEKMICAQGGIYVLIREKNVEHILEIVELKYQELKGEL